MDIPITENLAFIARVDTRFVGKTWFYTVQEGQRPTIFMPLFELGFGPGAGGPGIAEYSVSRRDAFATVDLRAGIQGENWTRSGFVMNATNEKYLEEVIPALEFGGSFDHPGSLRRYGVELQFNF